MSTTARREADALRFIIGFQAANGFGPTVRQIATGIGIGGLATIAEVLDQLENDGRIRRLRRKVRAIEVIDRLPIPRTPDGAPLFFVRVREVRP